MIRFFSDEYISSPWNCHSACIPVIDDNINEANQVFVIQLSLEPEVLNEDPITLSHNVSLVQIIDNNREWTIHLHVILITVFSLPIVEKKLRSSAPYLLLKVN